MGRIHLFEFEDLPWFPAFLRDYMTDFLQFLSNKTHLYKPILPILQKALAENGDHQVVDLASGGGGGWLWINEELRKTYPDLKITLTDYFPNIKAFRYVTTQADNIEYMAEPVDARNVPSALKGLRTQFLSLHHFEPKDAQGILQNAVEAKRGIVIIEGQERSIMSLIPMLLSPISVLLTTPFIKPFKVGRIIFTYFIPLVPVLVLWDGVVSCLRTYSVGEMGKLVESIQNNEFFEWQIGKIKSGPGRLLYLYGKNKINS